MTPSLSPPFQRALALTILLGVLATIYYAAIQPVIDAYTADRVAIVERSEALTRYQRAAREFPARERALAALKRQQTQSDGLLEGASDTLIAAQIQNIVNALAKRTNTEVKSSQILPPQPQGKLKRIAVREQITATMADVLAIFHDLEAQSPLLFLDNVTLQVPPLALRDRDAPGTGDTIDVLFDVYGYSRVTD